jgi:hypothetical protein
MYIETIERPSEVLNEFGGVGVGHLQSFLQVGPGAEGSSQCTADDDRSCTFVGVDLRDCFI